jgi:hypothetical protein
MEFLDKETERSEAVQATESHLLLLLGFSLAIFPRLSMPCLSRRRRRRISSFFFNLQQSRPDPKESGAFRFCSPFIQAPPRIIRGFKLPCPTAGMPASCKRVRCHRPAAKTSKRH